MSLVLWYVTLCCVVLQFLFKNHCGKEHDDKEGAPRNACHHACFCNHHAGFARVVLLGFHRCLVLNISR